MCTRKTYCSVGFLLTALAACGGGGDGLTTISGQFVDWDGATGYAFEGALLMGSTSGPTVTTAQIDGQGRFLVALPGAGAMDPLASPLAGRLGIGSCSPGSVQVSPPDLKGALLATRAVKASSPTRAANYYYAPSGAPSPGGLTFINAMYLYSVGAGSIRGTCSGSRWDLTLGPGWNYFTSTGYTDRTEYTSAAPSAEAKWLSMIR